MEGEVVSSKPNNEPRKKKQKKKIKLTTRLLAGRLNSSFHFLICFCTLQSLFTTMLKHIANYYFLFDKVINMEDTAIYPCVIHHLRKRISVMDLKSDSTTNQSRLIALHLTLCAIGSFKVQK